MKAIVDQICTGLNKNYKSVSILIIEKCRN